MCKIAATTLVLCYGMVYYYPARDMATSMSACQRHVDLKNLTCSNVAKQLKGFRLEHFFCSAPFSHSLTLTQPLALCLTLSRVHTHTHTHTRSASTLSFSVWRTWSAALEICFFALWQSKKGENLHLPMCVCVWGRCGKCVLTSVTYA